MSFSLEVKKEIMSAKSGENDFALLSGAVLSSGSLVLLGAKGMSFRLSSENEDFIEFIKNLIIRNYPGAKFTLETQNVAFKQRTRTELLIDPKSGRQILTDLGILSFSKNGSYEINRLADASLTQEESSKIDYIKGLFLGGGSISVPESVDIADISKIGRNSGYHMEWSGLSSELADHICELLAGFDIISRKVERNDNFVVYIKESESISSLLALFGAHKNLLKFENDRAGRQIRNLVNRQSNCISANIDKSIRAAEAQLRAIETIKETIGLEALPNSLLDVALARLANPEGSLSEIAEIMPVKVSRGAIAQRFKKIMEIAKEVG